MPSHATLCSQHFLTHGARKFDIGMQCTHVHPQLRFRRKFLLAKFTWEAATCLAVGVLVVKAQALLRAEGLVTFVALVDDGTTDAMHGLLVILDAGEGAKASLAFVAAVGGQLFAVLGVLVIDFAAFR